MPSNSHNDFPQWLLTKSVLKLYDVILISSSLRPSQNQKKALLKGSINPYKKVEKK
tara:strand:+ start:913 stop:1080 length:168 start_codon:yes stop_codon:yes gene_type:complete